MDDLGYVSAEVLYSEENLPWTEGHSYTLSDVLRKVVTMFIKVGTVLRLGWPSLLTHDVQPLRQPIPADVTDVDLYHDYVHESKGECINKTGDGVTGHAEIRVDG